MTTGAVIVAAGMATRMHEFKQLMRIAGRPMAERVILNFREAGVAPIIVVTGYRAAELEAALQYPDILFVRNEAYETTQMFDSAKIGLAAIKDRCDRTFFCPADIPMFTSVTVRQLMQYKAPLVLPICRGKQGHPILIENSLIPQILAWQGEGGLKGALNGLSAQSLRVEADDPGTLAGADTQEEFRHLAEMAEHN